MWAVLFPGQGSQKIGMGKVFYENFKEARELFEEASDTLSLDFRKLCFEGPLEELTLTENTQPCLLLVSYMSYKILQQTCNFTPHLASGHSIGEYGALVSAQVISFSEALKVVRKRGEFMQKAVPSGKGGMLAALNFTKDQITYICKEFQVEAANFNSPQQVVLSGKASNLQNLKENMKVESLPGEVSRIKLIPLQVSAPFHSSLMKPAEENMKPLLESLDFQRAQFPVVQNLTGQVETKPQNLQKNLIAQISGSVLWTSCVNTLYEKGIKKTVEMGPGKVLSGLVQKIHSEIKTFSLNSLEDLKNLESHYEGS